MSSTVLEVGTGVFVVALIWIAALVFGMVLLRASESAKLGVIPVFLLALIITLALVCFPRSRETTPPFKEVQIVDNLFIVRYVLLAVVSVVFLMMFFMLLPFHFLEPVYAKALGTH
ncbi:transmembrane protein 218-like [Limanda limanda]|uniref:transmembrane protein 218-like n=1 Tax=Limanda limanda TaxID=27771 RepID=UPI0029C828F3|nr:transmembrane protein 218-like [Limanda limanda]